MDKYVIEGGRRLYGTVPIASAKNAVLPLFAASILTEEKVIIKEVPAISDALCMAQILRELGADVRFAVPTSWWTVKTRLRTSFLPS